MNHLQSNELVVNTIEKSLKIDSHLLAKTLNIIKAIKHPLRYKIIQLLHREKALTVTEIYTALNLEQSVASQHLSILFKTGFIQRKRTGKYIVYTINYKRFEGLKEFLGKLNHN